jgi:hypothetical protein
VPGGNYAGRNCGESLAEWERGRKERIEIFLDRRGSVRRGKSRRGKRGEQAFD